MVVRLISVLLAVILMMGTSGRLSPASAASRTKTGEVKSLKAIRESANSIRLTWSRASGAAGYAVYRYDSDKKRYTKEAEVRGAKRTSFTDNGLTPERIYRYKVRAFAKKKSKRFYGKMSYSVTSRPYDSDSKKVNAGRVDFAFYKQSFGYLDTWKAKAYVYPSNSSKAKGRKPISKNVRWFSSDKAIATVSKDGRIATTKKPGTCYVYAMAHNGVRGKLKVRVRDYARPASFDTDGIEGDGLLLLARYKDDICTIAAYFHLNRPRDEETILLNDGELLIEPDENYDIKAVMRPVLRVLAGIPDENLLISVDRNFLTFNMTEYRGVDENGEDIRIFHEVKYYFNREVYDWDPDSYVFDEIAPHWGYSVRMLDNDDE
jgi:hypothetical protein